MYRQSQTQRVIGIADNVVREVQKPVKISGQQGKALRAFGNAMDSLSFDPKDFAQMLVMLSIPVQKRFIAVVVAYFSILSSRVDAGLGEFASEDEYDILMNGKLVHETIKRFFP